VSPENLPHVTPLREQLARPIQGASMVLLATAAFVLLIACANISQLLLARLNERRQEFTVRAALGASRARLIQQLIVEAMALTVTASVAGLWMAGQTTRWMAVFAPASLDSQVYSILDARVLGFAVGIALLSGLLFGVSPAWALTKGLRSSTAGASRWKLGWSQCRRGSRWYFVAGAFTIGQAFLGMLDADLGIPRTTIALNASLEARLPRQSCIVLSAWWNACAPCLA
jgi:hypothetical protein